MKLLIFFMLLPMLASHLAGSADASPVRPGGVIKSWVILGPFPNPKREPDSGDRGAFDIDYLKPIGGEVKARIKPNTTVSSADLKGETLRAKQVTIEGVSLDFAKHYTDTDYKLAYAYAEIESPADQDALLFMGSDDGAKVWINGKMAFETLPPTGRGFVARSDKFKVKLREGINTVLVKVENGYGGWQLGLECYAGEQARKIEFELKLEENKRQFQAQELTLSQPWPGYVFWLEWGGAPRIIWRDVDKVRELVGQVPFEIRWFDADLKEVKEPKKLGRYAAYIEGVVSGGTPFKRAMTFYCASPELELWADWGLDVPYLGKPVDRATWEERKDITAQTAGRIFRDSLVMTQDGAITIAGLCESKPNGGICTMTESPEVMNDDYHLKLKLKLAKLEGKTKPLSPPKDRSASPAPVIRQGTPAEAGMKPDAKEKIDAICREWAEASKEPFTVLVARKGVIITHEAFGKTADGTPVTLDYRKDVMSITKAVSGMLFSQFLDQGYVKLDDPIGKCFPDFPTDGERKLTFRHLFTHTSGLNGHGEWGGVHNPYLDNVVLNGLDYLHPGQAHIYNGMGYDLAGKAMEMMTEKSIFKLFHDHLYRPLGIKNVPMSDLAFSARLTSHELGVLGQWLANHGSYGDKRFISEETFKTLLPEPLSKYYPGLDLDWGIGLTWFREQKPGTPAGSKDPKDLILGEHVIGHGSASACILRVDLDHDLVIAQIRQTAGDKYEEYIQKFLQAVAESVL